MRIRNWYKRNLARAKVDEGRVLICSGGVEKPFVQIRIKNEENKTLTLTMEPEEGLKLAQDLMEHSKKPQLYI